METTAYAVILCLAGLWLGFVLAYCPLFVVSLFCGSQNDRTKLAEISHHTWAECHPGRPTIPDDPIARAIFMVAEANRTADGFLTADEMSDIFVKFDINGDGAVDETEFIAHWTLLKLGDLTHAVTLFHRADTNRDGRISRDPDFSRLFYYFDRSNDGKISEAEFVNVWFSLST